MPCSLFKLLKELCILNLVSFYSHFIITHGFVLVYHWVQKGSRGVNTFSNACIKTCGKMFIVHVFQVITALTHAELLLLSEFAPTFGQNASWGNKDNSTWEKKINEKFRCKSEVINVRRTLFRIYGYVIRHAVFSLAVTSFYALLLFSNFLVMTKLFKRLKLAFNLRQNTEIGGWSPGVDCQQ